MQMDSQKDQRHNCRLTDFGATSTRVRSDEEAVASKERRQRVKGRKVQSEYANPKTNSEDYDNSDVRSIL